LKSLGEDEDEDEPSSGASKDDDDPNKGGNGVTIPFSSEAAEKATKPPAIKPVMKPDTVYNSSKSMTGRTSINTGFPLSYGSAELQGFK